MVTPQLVCYDKNTWKTMQQLTNWNTEWSKIFLPCLSIQNVAINLTCSWADEPFVKAILEGLTRLPNVKCVCIKVKSKNKKVAELLSAFEKANIFASFKTKNNLNETDFKNSAFYFGGCIHSIMSTGRNRTSC